MSRGEAQADQAEGEQRIRNTLFQEYNRGVYQDMAEADHMNVIDLHL